MTTTTKPTESDTLRITGQSTAYHYWHYCNYYNGCWQVDSVAYGSSSHRCTLTTSSRLGWPSNLTRWGDQGGRKDSMEYYYTGCSCHTKRGWWLSGTTTTYTYQTRSKTVTYGYYKWNDWSEWSETSASTTDTREVERRTVYRERTTVYSSMTGTEDASGTKRHVQGTLNVSADLAGKQAIVMVYNAVNSDPNEDQMQFIGQTTIGSGNSYSFDFIPKSDPTADSGDFIVALGVKGSTGLVNVDVIKAPKPVYKVSFQYEDENGNVTTVSSQNVSEGSDAVIPTAPERPGYRFVGWNDSATKVNDNMVVSALYAAETYAVVWVDWAKQSTLMETYKYGDELVAPEKRSGADEGDGVVGRTFKGWDALEKGMTSVTQNMVINSVYEDEEFTVNFLDADGNVLDAQKVSYGKAASLPAIEPTSAGKVFKGWSTSDENPWWNVQSDMNVSPIFAYDETASAPSAEAVDEGKTGAKGQVLMLESSTEGAEIYYTTDGSTPSLEASGTAKDDVDSEGAVVENTTKKYDPAAGITVKEPTTVKAIAVADGMEASSMFQKKVDVEAVTDVSLMDVEAFDAYFFEPEPAESYVSVTVGNVVLIEGTDYSVEYSSNNAVGTGRATVMGIGDYSGLKSVEYNILDSSLLKAGPDYSTPKGVAAAMNELPGVDQITLADKELVESVRAAYDALSSEDKALVPAESLALLKAAEDRIAELEAPAPDPDPDPDPDPAPTPTPTPDPDPDPDPDPAPKPARLAKGKTITGGNLTYTVLTDRASVSVKVRSTKRKTVTSVSVPSKVKDKNGYTYKVAYVSKSGFKGCTKLTSAKVYSSYLKGIGSYAFYGCSRLKSVYAGSAYIASIGSKALYGTKALTSVSMPRTARLKSVTYAFLGAGKNGGRSLYVKVKSSKLKSYKSLILKKGGNKKLTVKKA